MRGLACIIWLALSLCSAVAQPQCPLTPAPGTSNSLCASTAFVSRAASSSPSAPQGRLTLTNGVAVTTTDVTGATTLYYMPSAGGSYIPLTTDGISFAMTVFSQLSLTNSGLIANSCYDEFIWSNSGVVTFSFGPAWTTCDGAGATRGTGAGTSEIDFTTRFPTNKNAIGGGPGANLGTLVGTIRTNGSAQFTDSLAFRYVSNSYNQALRPMQVFEPSSSWNYTIATFRQANANSANQLAFVQSLAGNELVSRVVTTYENGTTGQFGIVAVDIDVVNTVAITHCLTSSPTVGTSGQLVNTWSQCNSFPGLGGHIAIWKEYGSAVGTGTFFGTGGGTVIQGGISGDIFN
jgi:hypothetical protein